MKKKMKYLIIGSLGMILPSIVVFIVYLLTKIRIKFGIVVNGNNISLFDYIYLYVTVLSVEVTTYFSIAVVNLSKSSNNQTEQMIIIEKNREEKVICDSSKYIYMDLWNLIIKAADIMIKYAQHNIKLTRRDFNEVHNDRTNFTYFRTLGPASTEWKQYLSKLSNTSINSEDIYKLYLDFYTPQSFSNDKDLRGCIVSMPRYIFTKDFNERWDSIDNNFWRYNEYSKCKLNEDDKNKILADCIQRAEVFKTYINNINAKDIINQDWYKILDELRLVCHFKTIL